MTAKLITCLCATLVLASLSSCTTTTTTTAGRETPPYDQTKKRVYTQQQLQKTGESTNAAALEKLDPSVRVHGTR